MQSLITRTLLLHKSLLVCLTLLRSSGWAGLVVSSNSTCCVLIILPCAGHVHLFASSSYKHFKKILSQELFFSLHFYTVQNLIYGRGHIWIQVPRAAFYHLNMEANFNLCCCLHYLQQQLESQRKQTVWHTSIHFRTNAAIYLNHPV